MSTATPGRLVELAFPEVCPTHQQRRGRLSAGRLLAPLSPPPPCANAPLLSVRKWDPHGEHPILHPHQSSCEYRKVKLLCVLSATGKATQSRWSARPNSIQTKNMPYHPVCEVARTSDDELLILSARPYNRLVIYCTSIRAVVLLMAALCTPVVKMSIQCIF